VIFNDLSKAEKLFPVPIMQCLQVKQIKQVTANGQAEDRYRLVLNDGEHYIQSVLATSHSYLAREEKLQRGCFLRIKRYQPNNLKGKR
jgi:replication factor A1